MAFQTSLSGLNAAQTNLSVTGNNIANASTNGFKRSRAEFADIYATSFSSTSQVGSGVRVANIGQQFAQGNVEFTDNSLDLSISGEGFFILRDTSGAEFYTRAGAYQVDRDGFIVNSRDQRLQGYAPTVLGDLRIDNAASPANATTSTEINLNLNANAISPIVDAVSTVYTSDPISSFDFTPSPGSAAAYSFAASALFANYSPTAADSGDFGAFTPITNTDSVVNATYTLGFSSAGAALDDFDITVPILSNGGILTAADIATALSNVSGNFDTDGGTYNGYTVDFGGAASLEGAIDTGSISFSRADGNNFSVAENAELDAASTDGDVDADFAFTNVGASLLTTSGADNSVSFTVTDPDGNAVAVMLDENITTAEQLLNAITSSPDYDVNNFTASTDGTDITFNDAVNATGAFQISGVTIAAADVVTNDAGEDPSLTGTTVTITGPDGINQTIVLASNLGSIEALAAELAGPGYIVNVVGEDGDTLEFVAEDPQSGEFSFNFTTGTNFIGGSTTVDGANAVVFNRNNPNTYNFSTSTTIYDSLGRSHTQTVFFVKDNTEANTWDTYVFVGNEQIVPTNPDDARVVFNTNGQLAAGTTATTYGTFTPLTDGITGQEANPMVIVVDYDGSTQFAAQSAVNGLFQDGYTSGRISGVNIDSNGVIFARYTNGQSTALGTVALARFENPNGLQPVGDTNWARTFQAGEMVPGMAGTGSLGQIQSGALEASNVDLSAALVNMIIAQRDFQANAKMISTEDAITQTIINIR